MPQVLDEEGVRKFSDTYQHQQTEQTYRSQQAQDLIAELEREIPGIPGTQTPQSVCCAPKEAAAC